MRFLVVFALVLVELAFGASVFEAPVRYDGYKVYEITPENIEQAKLLADLQDNADFDVWSAPKTLGKPFNIMVTPQAQESFENTLSDSGVDWKVLINNVQDTIDEEDRTRMLTRVARGGITFSQYMTHSEINAYLRSLAERYPNIVKLVDFGRSYEEREMLLVQISSGGTNKPSIFVDAGIHAREWVAPPTALYLINQLVENPQNAALYANIDWHIIPVLNPDGYMFTQTGDRMWRKTRTLGPSGQCYGTDPNRNFDYQWMVSGASQNECTQTYAGPFAFSEIESRNLRDYLLAHNDTIKLYLTVHSFGNYLLYPWGYTTTEMPENAEELQALGELVNDAIHAVAGTNYTVGMITHLLGNGAGGSDDWAKAVAGIELSYCIEMTGGGSTGFNLPANRILHTVSEMFEGFKAYHRYIEQKFVTRVQN